MSARPFKTHAEASRHELCIGCDAPPTRGTALCDACYPLWVKDYDAHFGEAEYPLDEDRYDAYVVDWCNARYEATHARICLCGEGELSGDEYACPACVEELLRS